MNKMHFRANLPYPVVKGLQPDMHQAMMLMEGYSGRLSELSTVAQYAYHTIKCNSHKELSQVMHQIFLVETDHLRFLGSCIQQLGVDPRYFLYCRQGQSFWQANLVNYENTVEEMLLADIEGEKSAVEFYTGTAQTINNEKIAALLLRLAEDEKLHVKIFQSYYQKLFPQAVEKQKS